MGTTLVSMVASNVDTSDSLSFVFVSNYLTIHQKPFCDELVKLLGEDSFKFIACDELEGYRATTAYEDLNNEPYVIRAYESASIYKLAKSLVEKADVAIVSIGYPGWMEIRRSHDCGLTYIYIERLLKLGLWYRYSLYPKYIQAWRNVLRYRNDRRFHVLCASAFGSYDLQLFKPNFPLDRCWKWGYFPAVERGPKKSCHTQEELVWVGRLIKLKRPFLALEAMHAIRKSGHDVHLKMIGGGPLEEELREYVRDKKLSCVVEITGAMPNSVVRDEMSSAGAIVFTSSRREGWGAVLNEAMADGCIPIASSTIGSVPYLVNHDENGFIFQDGDARSLERQLKTYLSMDSVEFSKISDAARLSISSTWNPSTAAARLLKLSAQLISGAAFVPEEHGPCSRAQIIKDDWFGL